MPTTPTGGKSDIAKIVEKQMRNWELGHAQRVQPHADEAAPDVAEFVTISRAIGSGGSQVAELLGERLGWPVFDREILQAMAGDDQVRTRLYEHMDERDHNWLDATVRWLIGGELRKDDYFYRLTETVLTLARKGPGVFLGRGGDLILPRDRGLRVRVTASPEQRAEALAKRTDSTPALARAEVERIDQERAEFRRHRFGKDANDLTRHDLAINLDRFTVEQAVGLIVAAMSARGMTR
jgi:cytidylate kinase